LETGELKEERSKGSDETETNSSKYLSAVGNIYLSSLLQWDSNIKNIKQISNSSTINTDQNSTLHKNTPTTPTNAPNTPPKTGTTLSIRPLAAPLLLVVATLPLEVATTPVPVSVPVLVMATEPEPELVVATPPFPVVCTAVTDVVSTPEGI
jgi:hypothetical protein